MKEDSPHIVMVASPFGSLEQKIIMQTIHIQIVKETKAPYFKCVILRIIDNGNEMTTAPRIGIKDEWLA